MSWIDLGDTTKGVLIGGGITLTTSVVLEWFRSRSALKQQKALFTLQSAEARAVTTRRNIREDEVAKREKDRAEEDAARQERIWAKQKIWDRRVEAYDGTLKRLKEMHDAFEMEMSHALDPGHVVDEEHPYAPTAGWETVPRIAPLLDLDRLFLNDRSITSLEQLHSEMRDAVAKAREASSSMQIRNQIICEIGIGATKKAMQTIRQEGLEHLGDKGRSLTNIADDAFKLASGS